MAAAGRVSGPGPGRLRPRGVAEARPSRRLAHRYPFSPRPYDLPIFLLPKEELHGLRRRTQGMVSLNVFDYMFE